MAGAGEASPAATPTAVCPAPSSLTQAGVGGRVALLYILCLDMFRKHVTKKSYMMRKVRQVGLSGLSVLTTNNMSAEAGRKS